MQWFLVWNNVAHILLQGRKMIVRNRVPAYLLGTGRFTYYDFEDEMTMVVGMTTQILGLVVKDV